MAIGSRAFCLPRRGNNLDEYEDAIALENASGRYALADGASEGCFTGLWARLLVKDFVSHAEVNISRWLSSLFAVQERWGKDVGARKLDWDADYWVEQGAFAAFLGLVLTAAEAKEPQGFCTWQAVAIGDTCLFHTRDSVLLSAFPLARSDQFGNRPQLVGSRMPTAAVLQRQRLWNEGSGQPGDRLWAMTDALAKWCLTEHEAGGDPSRELESLLASPQDGGLFAEWIEALRETGRLLNDDVTLLAIPL